MADIELLHRQVMKFGEDILTENNTDIVLSKIQIYENNISQFIQMLQDIVEMTPYNKKLVLDVKILNDKITEFLRARSINIKSVIQSANKKNSILKIYSGYSEDSLINKKV